MFFVAGVVEGKTQEGEVGDGVGRDENRMREENQMRKEGPGSACLARVAWYSATRALKK